MRRRRERRRGNVKWKEGEGKIRNDKWRTLENRNLSRKRSRRKWKIEIEIEESTRKGRSRRE